MPYSIKQKKLIVSGALLGSILSLPLLTYAENANIIANSGLETADPSDAKIPEKWEKGFWGTNDAVFSYPAPGTDGTKVAKIEITAYTNGDAKWLFKDVPVLSGEQYVFSDHYLANIPAEVVARYTLLNGNYAYEYLGTSVVSKEWTGYATLPFTIPNNAISLTVFHLIHETGSLSIDDVSLRPLTITKKLPETLLPASTISSVNGGGVVPLSYLTHDSNVQMPYVFLSKNAATPSTIIDRNFKTPPPHATKETISSHIASIVNKSGIISFIHPAEAAEETPSHFPSKDIMGVAPLGILAADFSNLSLAFSGILLILLSIGLSLFLLGFQNRRKRERETQLWEL